MNAASSAAPILKPILKPIWGSELDFTPACIGQRTQTFALAQLGKFPIVSFDQLS